MGLIYACLIACAAILPWSRLDSWFPSNTYARAAIVNTLTITMKQTGRMSSRTLVGNVGDMSAHVAVTLTCSAKNWPMPNVADAMTGFMAGSCVGWRVMHDCLVISMTHVAITPMEVTVVFQEKMVHINEIMHTIPCSRLSCTKSYHYGMIFCEALLFFFVQKI